MQYVWLQLSFSLQRRDIFLATNLTQPQIQGKGGDTLNFVCLNIPTDKKFYLKSVSSSVSNSFPPAILRNYAHFVHSVHILDRGPQFLGYLRTLTYIDRTLTHWLSSPTGGRGNISLVCKILYTYIQYPLQSGTHILMNTHIFWINIQQKEIRRMSFHLLH
jgi:hypothetical protein